MWSRTSLCLLLIPVAVSAQEANTPSPVETGYLYVDHTHDAWPSPDSLVSDLQSKDDGIRLKALRLLGFSEQESRAEVWSQSSPSRFLGYSVVTPDRVDITYAALGEDGTRQAIVSAEVGAHATMFAAVAVATGRGWERIGTFDCWCKYDLQDSLAGFVHLEPAPAPGPQTPQRFELVLRESGGGTGIYTQNEGHYRVYQGELKLVMTFVSRTRSCDPIGPSPHWCNVERRWFYTTAFGNTLGAVVVSAGGRFPIDNAPQTTWFVRDLESRYVGEPSCSAYRWDAQSFQYLPITITDPCKPHAP